MKPAVTPTMSPNGAVLFVIAFTVAVFVAPGLHGLVILTLLAVAFAVIELRLRALRALMRTLVMVAPLAAFMALVWVGIVGRSPAEIAAGLSGSRDAALAHVVHISARLFLMVFVLQAVVLRLAGLTALAFVQALALPLAAKRLIALTLSLTETLKQAIERAHTALIAAGVLTRTLSFKNLRNGFLLIQTVWLTAVTIAMGRMRDKWPVEHTLERLDRALAPASPRVLDGDDLVWLPIMCGAAAVAWLAG
jgi:energy-coupling factor transporter transmembrane protein EcfT